jgi:hypothetical protein
MGFTLEYLATVGASHGSVFGDVGHDVADEETTDLSFILAGTPTTFWLLSLCCSRLADVGFDNVVLQTSQCLGQVV